MYFSEKTSAWVRLSKRAERPISASTDFGKWEEAVSSELLTLECRRTLHRLRLIGELGDEDMAYFSALVSEFMDTIDIYSSDELPDGSGSHGFSNRHREPRCHSSGKPSGVSRRYKAPRGLAFARPSVGPRGPEPGGSIHHIALTHSES